MAAGDEQDEPEIDVELGLEDMEALPPADQAMEIFREPDPDEGDDEPTMVFRAPASSDATDELAEATGEDDASPAESGDEAFEASEAVPSIANEAEGGAALLVPAASSVGDGPALDDEAVDATPDARGAAASASSDAEDAPRAEPPPRGLRASQPPPAPPGGPLPAVAVDDNVPTETRPLRLIAVGGARGGVGKTILAANLGLYLASIGRRVVVVDADAAGANLHTCLGTRNPAPLSRLRRGGRGESVPPQAIHETPVKGLSLIHLGFDEPATGSPRADRLVKALSRLRALDAEYVVVDLGVGLGRDVLDAYLAADLSLFVTVPEPTAMENTYRFLRGCFGRFLGERIEHEDDLAEIDRRMKAHGGAPPPLDLLRELEGEGHPLAGLVRDAMEAFRPRLVVNQTRLRTDLQLGQAVQSAARRRLGLLVDHVGNIDSDDTVWTCVRNRRPLLLEVPGAKSSKKIEKVARRLLMIEAGKAPPPRMPGVPVDSHHDLLEVERGATDEEVRRAYKRCREVYSHDALCCYGLLDPHEVENLRSRIDEAFDVLLDPARRRPYELSVFPEAEPPEPRRQFVPEDLLDDDEQVRPAPEITPDTQFTGSLLRQVRESQRATLHEISQRTKIGVSYLRAIEEDDFGKLPAPVYTTGFVTQVARYLKLNPQQVSQTYVSRYKQYLDDKERAFVRRA